MLERVPAREIAVGVVAATLLLDSAKLAGLVHLSSGEIVVINIRLLAPLLILRFWLVGGLVAMLTDLIDVIVIEFVGMGGFGAHYEQTDKLLDSYYYVLELVVALTWTSRWLRVPAALLFAYRLAGALLFEATGARALLIVFPNLFENWWLYCVVTLKWFPSLVPASWKGVLLAGAALLAPKLAQEYLLHVAEAEPWDWTKEHLLEPAGINF